MAKRILAIAFSIMCIGAAFAFAHGSREKTTPSAATSSSTTMTAASGSMYGGTVNLGGSAVTEITPTFNPFAPNPDQGIYFVYEPLMYVNPLNGNDIPFLATAYKWTDNNLKLDVTLRSGVKWNDGQPFTSKDVVFTFNMLKKYPALDTVGLWASGSDMTSVKATGPDSVVFSFSKPNVPQSFYILRTVIVPQHIWAGISDPVKFQDANNPVGTGPFLRTSYSVSNNVETLTKNPNYWMTGHPYVSKLRIIGNQSNQSAFLQEIKGETVEEDIAITEPDKTWVARDPKANLLFWPVHTFNDLTLNDAKAPFNSVVFRKALSLAIDKHLLEQRAFYGTGGYDISQTTVIPAQRAQWYDPSLQSQDSAETQYNPQKALQMLENAGYQKTANGLLYPDGKPVPTLSYLMGAGWTDAATIGQILTQELKNNLGITLQVNQQAYSTYLTLLETGSFDMAYANPPVSGPTPYFAFNSMFNSQFAAPIGSNAISNYSRFTSPAIDKALAEFASSSNLQQQKQAMYKIEKIMVDQVPTIVITNRTGFDVYNSKEFVGWPTVQDPYSNGWNGNGLGMLPVVNRLHKRTN